MNPSNFPANLEIESWRVFDVCGKIDGVVRIVHDDERAVEADAILPNLFLRVTVGQVGRCDSGLVQFRNLAPFVCLDLAAARFLVGLRLAGG